MQLHEELNIETKINNNQELPQLDENEIYKNCCKNARYEYKSIIFDLLFVVFKSNIIKDKLFIFNYYS